MENKPGLGLPTRRGFARMHSQMKDFVNTRPIFDVAASAAGRPVVSTNVLGILLPGLITGRGRIGLA